MTNSYDRLTLLFLADSLYLERFHNAKVVKITDHDYQGQYITPSALTAWIHRMRGFDMHQSFQPDEGDFSTQETSITARSSPQIALIYGEFDKGGINIVDGTCPTVSISGHLTGRGHSVMPSKFGLAADQVLQMEIVTPQGEVIIVNKCQKQKTFQAMRGAASSHLH